MNNCLLKGKLDQGDYLNFEEFDLSLSTYN